MRQNFDDVRLFFSLMGLVVVPFGLFEGILLVELGVKKEIHRISFG